MDEALEDAYQSYLKRKGKREELEAAKEEAMVAKRARLGKGSDLAGDASADEDADTDAPATFGTAPRPWRMTKRSISYTVDVSQHPDVRPWK